MRLHPSRPRRGLRVTTAAVAVAAVTGLTACGAGGPVEPGPSPAAAAPTTAAPLERADVDAWLDGVLPTELDAAGIAGATVSVVHDGEVLTARGYGWADTGADGGEPVPVDPSSTLFRVGSVSKLVTATAVMQLVESGDVDLDTDVEEYVDVDLRRAFDAPVTLRHLLTHTGGFEERVRGLIGTPGSTADLRAAVTTDPPEQVYAPGTVPAYSNYGNALAGYVVERVSGTPFEEYAERNVLGPLGMRSSSFAQPLPDDLAGRAARGYADVDAPATPFEVVGVAPAGALSATGTDMAAFMLAMLGETPSGAAVLEPETLELMQTPALDEDSLGGLATGRRMTLGFFDESTNGHRVLGHGGDTNVFHSHLQVLPDDRTGIFVAMNSSGTTPTASVGLRERLVQGFADRYFPGDTPTAAGVDEATAREHAAAMEGTWTSSRRMSSTFASAVSLLDRSTVTALPDGRLHVDPAPVSLEAAVFTEVEPWLWREDGGDRTLAARVVDGRVEAVGAESAFAILPVEPARERAVVLPVVVGSLVVLVLGTLGWLVSPLVRLVRRRRGTTPVPADGTTRPGRSVGLLTRAGAACAVLAVAGWVAVVSAALGLGEVPTAALRAVQVVQALGVLALVPAAGQLVGRVRRRAGGWAVARGAAVLVALAGLAWFAVEFRLLSLDVSY